MAGICGVVSAQREKSCAGTAQAMAARLAVQRRSCVELRSGRGWCLSLCHRADAAMDGGAGRDLETEISCILDGWLFDTAALEAVLGGSDDARMARPADMVAAAFGRVGRPALELLRGQFAAALWDGRSRTLYLVSDKCGSRNLYWTVRSGNLYFASELKALLAIPGLSLRLDEEGLAEYLTFGYPLGDRTLFDGVRLMLPGCVLKVCDGVVRMERYWKPDMGEGRTAPRLEECVEELDALLDRACRRRGRVGARVALGLSGGRDSRILAGYLAREGRDGMEFRSFGPRGRGDEAWIAEAVAAAAGARFRHVAVGAEDLAQGLEENAWLTEGVINTSEFRVLASEHPHCDAVVWGFGGDVLSGMPLHPTMYGARTRAQISSLHLEADASEMIPVRQHGEAFHPDFAARTKGAVVENFARCFARLPCNDLPNLWMLHDLSQRQRRRTLRVMTVTDAVCDTLFPYLDDDVLEFSLAQPVRFKQHRRVYAELLNRRFPRLADLPRPNYRVSMRWETRLLRPVLWARRLAHRWDGGGRGTCGAPRGLDAQYAVALSGPLRSYCESALCSLAQGRQILAESFVRKLLDSKDLLGGGHYLLLKLMTLDTFLGQMLDNRAPAVPVVAEAHSARGSGQSALREM